MLQQDDVFMRSICPPTYRSAQQVQCQKRPLFFLFDYKDLSAAQQLRVIIKMTTSCPNTGRYN